MNSLLRYLTFLLILFLFSPPISAQNRLEKIEYSSEDEIRTFIKIYSRSTPHYEIFENIKSGILIVKFRNTTPGNFPTIQAFDNHLISGIQTQKIDENEYWVKIKTKFRDLEYRVVPGAKDPSILTLELSRPVDAALAMSGPRILNMLRELNPKSERLVVYLDKLPEFGLITENKKDRGNVVQIRFLNTQIAPQVIVPGSDTNIIKSISFVERGKYLLMEILAQKYSLKIQPEVIDKPLRILFNITEDKTQTLEEKETIAKEEQKEEEEEKKELNKKISFLENKFQDAERNFRRGRLKTAELQFKNIFNFAPETEIGVRANFRAADSHYQRQFIKKIINEDHFVIQEYQAAISSALEADLGYDYIPRAFYNMGRSYLNLKSYSDAFSQFDVIRKNYPESPYSKNALLQQGKIHLNMFRYEQSIETLKKFVLENKNAPQIPEAYYKIGESQFQLKLYQESKRSFDRAWSMDGEYMKQDPELMFYMGEAYFVNQEYQTARSIYEQLMDLYPTQSFSNLVAIRIGDFLRAEEKENDAIRAYEKAIVQYTKDLLLIGKLRIANILAERAKKDEHKKALEIYNFILEKHPLSNQVEEATLRRSLTLALFQYFPVAVEALEAFCQRYPANIYVNNGIIHSRLLETIKDYISDYYHQGRYLDALGVFEQYEKKYYLHPAESSCFHSKTKTEFGVRTKSILDQAPLFLIADSYYRLGLNDKALKIFDQIIADDKDPLNP
ncbi:MAG: tetratricopeptide repeat protein, partial [Proteobacteria bacterium]|nr:tetratricopeptide repeat protein [Pseudomonadota bacterium]